MRSLWCALLCIPVHGIVAGQYPLYFCTASSPNYYKALLNFIGSVHKSHFNDLGEIAVFDLGLEPEQLNELARIERVRVCTLERKHDNIIKPLPKAGTKGLPKVSAYAFKPVAVKQALEMYPYFLWLDAGSTVFGSIRILFDHIREKGYFLHNGSGWSLRKQLCSYPARTFELHRKDRRWILGPKILGIESGVMGLTPAVRERLVLPVYEAAADLNNFIDDGTSGGGRGTGRHDQAVIAVQARIAELYIHQHSSAPLFLQVAGRKHPFRITNYKVDPFKNNFRGIMSSRQRLPWFSYFYSQIRWRK